MEIALQYLINGLMLGVMYGLVAVGFTLFFGVLDVIKFSHGDVLTVGVFTGFATYLAMKAAQVGSPLVQLIVVSIVAMAAMAALGAVIARTLVLPLSSAPALNTLLITLMLGTVLREGVRVAFTASIGNDQNAVEGLFVGDLQSLGTIALVGQALDGTLTALSGRPIIDSDGAVTILGRVNSGGEHAAILRGNTAFFEPVAEVGDEGPVGGTIRSIGRPAVSPAGRAAFRTTFEPGSGGVGGFYLLNEVALAPFVSNGDAAPASIGGRFSSFNQRAALNSSDTLAFIASLSGGDVDNGLFLASPSSFQVKKARIKLGTATKADVKGYYIGGKTGTSEKVVGGRYSKNKLLTTFTAILPADKPRYQLLIMLDEPQGLPETHGYATSGWNAGPTAGKVIGRIAPMLGIEPRFDLPPAEQLILAKVRQ